MRKYLSVILFLIIILSCDRYPDPSLEILENYSFRFITSPEQRFKTGESLQVHYIIDANTGSTSDPFVVKFDVIRGGGSITVDSTIAYSHDTASAIWTLGSSDFQQIVKASAYTYSGKYLTSTTLTEYGFRTDQWDEMNSTTDGGMAELVSDSVNKVTLMISYGMVYKQKDNYWEWEQLDDPVLASALTIKIDQTGVIYVGTWDGTLLKSIDHGVSWKTCTRPFTKNSGSDQFFLYVSNDNWVWASKIDQTTRFSKDGGNTWTTAGSSLTSQAIGDVFRLKSGTILFHGGNCCSLFRSDDNGLNWTPIVTPTYSHKLFVNEKDEIFICAQDGGCSVYKSTDTGVTFDRVQRFYPKFNSSMNNVFNRRGNFYYMMIPGYGILKSYDLVSYETYWDNDNIYDLFIDHNGVLIAKDWGFRTIYYRKNSGVRQGVIH